MNPSTCEVPLKTRALEAAQRARDAGFLHFSAALLEVARRAPPVIPDHGAEPVSNLQPHDHESPT